MRKVPIPHPDKKPQGNLSTPQPRSMVVFTIPPPENHVVLLPCRMALASAQNPNDLLLIVLHNGILLLPLFQHAVISLNSAPK